MMQERKLSIIIPTGNRANIIEDCLKSCRWADELVVVDSFSTDGTLDIVRQYADRILQHEYINSAIQKNWAIPQAAHEWVMIVDTDERVTDELRQEVCQVLDSDSSGVGYRIPRISYMLGKPIKNCGYYPDYQIRLFKRDQGRYELRRVHAHVLLDGLCGTLKSPLIHYAHRSIEQTTKNLLILMTKWEAEQRVHEANQTGKSPTSHLWINLLLRPAAAFILRYFRQGGWREGYHGVVLSLLWAMYICITYMRVWEEQLPLSERWWHESWADLNEHDNGK